MSTKPFVKNNKKTVELLRKNSERSSLYIKDGEFIEDLPSENQKISEKLTDNNSNNINVKHSGANANEIKIIKSSIIEIIKRKTFHVSSLNKWNANLEYTHVRSLNKLNLVHDLDLIRECLFSLIKSGDVIKRTESSIRNVGERFQRLIPELGDLRVLKVKLSDKHYSRDDMVKSVASFKKDAIKAEEKMSLTKSSKHLKISKTTFYDIIKNNGIKPKNEGNMKTLTMSQLDNIKEIYEEMKNNRVWGSKKDSKVILNDNLLSDSHSELVSINNNIKALVSLFSDFIKIENKKSESIAKSNLIAMHEGIGDLINTMK